MELLIVVAIILIILMVAVPKMNSQLMQAREMGALREVRPSIRRKPNIMLNLAAMPRI